MREQGMFDPARLVFLDETATSTNMVRLRGRCPRGQRLIAHVPHGHWKTITFVAGLRRRAVVAPLVLDGPMNATIFVTYLKECLAPKLKRGDVVIAHPRKDPVYGAKGPLMRTWRKPIHRQSTKKRRAPVRARAH